MTPRRRRNALIAGTLALVVGSSPPACFRQRTPHARLPSDAELVRMVDSSGAVFVGQVIARGARTTAAVSVSRSTAIVKVLEVAPPESLSLLEPNELVTLRLRDTTSLLDGTSYAFVGNVLALDTGVVVAEITRLDASTPDLRSNAMSRLRAARTAAEDARLRQHLAGADAVVLGVVRSVASAPRDTARRSRTGEGSPNWQVARVDTRHVWRGKSGSPVMAFYFPGSRHIRFADAPRPGVRDSAIFIAHRGSVRVASGRDSTVMFLPHSLDLLSVTESTRVDRLLRRK